MKLATSQAIFGMKSIAKKRSTKGLSVLSVDLFVKALIAGAIMALCVMFYIWARVQVVQMTYQYNQQVKLQEDLLDQQRAYQLQVSILVAPDGLTRLAERDHFTYPGFHQIVALDHLTQKTVAHAEAKK